MNLIRIIKLKFYYLINRNTLISFIFAFLLIIGVLLIEILNLDQKRADEELINEYLINAYVYIKMFISILSMYLFSYAISFKNDFLIYLLLPLGVKREKNILASIILNGLLILFLNVLIFIACGYLALAIKSFKMTYDIIYAFINILALAYIYGLYAMLLMQILKNNFSIIIMIAIFIISNNMMEYRDNFFIKVLNLIIPSLDLNGNYLYNNLYLFILVIILITINMLIYHYRDLNF